MYNKNLRLICGFFIGFVVGVCFLSKPISALLKFLFN
jgi:hypothetical protein